MSQTFYHAKDLGELTPACHSELIFNFSAPSSQYSSSCDLSFSNSSSLSVLFPKPGILYWQIFVWLYHSYYLYVQLIYHVFSEAAPNCLISTSYISFHCITSLCFSSEHLPLSKIMIIHLWVYLVIFCLLLLGCKLQETRDFVLFTRLSPAPRTELA